ncbi:hypothetical protein FB384_004871 [Prauserella sediminis]|uniref:Uncharacterized protein n=1 Tax=Prauserella sediminis TaxID=577680 RepID=A0A839XQ07_9PSEU|nr:hypothetical protein [Prauserella sediminis]MBB3665912.1 hypothetical protein [Prauserella sediminis]
MSHTPAIADEVIYLTFQGDQRRAVVIGLNAVESELTLAVLKSSNPDQFDYVSIFAPHDPSGGDRGTWRYPSIPDQEPAPVDEPVAAAPQQPSPVPR